MTYQLSERARKLTSSAIRDLLKVTERPEVISFAGGIPSPLSFPIEHMRAASERVLSQDAVSALQYGPTEGYTPLRAWVAETLRSQGANVDPERVLITTGSQQGLDLLGKILLDKGSTAVVEAPTYLGALQSLSLSEPSYKTLPCDEDGPIVERGMSAQLTAARLLYCIPNFQNPTGRRMTLARRQGLLELAQSAGFPIIEDDPYSALSYAGDEVPSLLSLDSDAVVYLGSFSKVLAPGLRVGYLIAPEALYSKLVQAKQAADLHTPSFTQRVIYEAVKDGFLTQHIPRIRALYAEQCRVMLDALQREMPQWVRWNRPQGGMFIWMQLPAGNDATSLLALALQDNVAFVPGATFFAERPEPQTLRLSFATTTPERMYEGARRLGALIRQHCHPEDRVD
jgi:2-aminoadipate transaminase